MHIPKDYIQDYCGALLNIVHLLIAKRDQRHIDDLSMPAVLQLDGTYSGNYGKKVEQLERPAQLGPCHQPSSFLVHPDQIVLWKILTKTQYISKVTIEGFNKQFTSPVSSQQDWTLWKLLYERSKTLVFGPQLPASQLP